MKAIIDRIEESTAVLELQNGERITVDKSIVENAKEGDAVVIDENEVVVTDKIDTHSIFEKLRNKSKSHE